MIFVECNSDYQLILFILRNKNHIGHSGGKSKVLKDVLKFDESCIGLIDEDPESHRDPSLDQFDDVTDHGSYKICKNRSSDKLLFELKQDLETWLRVLAQNSGLNFKRSGLLDSSNRIRKTLNSSQKRKFQQFLDELLDKSSHFQEFVEIFRSANVSG